MRQPSIERVRDFWDSHLNLTQFLQESDGELGSEEFYARLERSLDRYKYKARLLYEFAKDVEGDSLLEVGCGLGLELARLARLGFRVTGVDLAPTAVRLCNEYLRRNGVEGEARVQNAENLEFADGHFDAVYSSGVLQHTPDASRAVAEMWRVLKPGGRILVVLYHRRSWFYLLHRIGRVNIEFDSEDAPIINAYSRSEAAELFKRFAELSIDVEHYRPNHSARNGPLVRIYNLLFVPAMSVIPKPLVKPFGWHLVIQGRK